MTEARRADHPHAGGENSTRTDASMPGVTDHPHAGGENDTGCVFDGADVRTIPTRVGSTAAVARRRSSEDGPSPRGWGERHTVAGRT